MKCWGFGIIGCGVISDFHIAAIKEIGNANIVALSSRNEQKVRTMAEQEQCAWTTDYRELLANPDVDIVCITTSSGSHGSIGIAALKAGKHVLVEKPMAMNLDEAQEMIQLAEQAGLQLAVISQRRFEQHYSKAKQMIESGHLGKILLIEANTPYYRTQAYYDSADWRGTIAEDGGALMNQGIHQIDLLLWYGGKVSTVYGKIATQTHRMEAEDIGLAIVTFANGTLGTIMSSTSIQPGFSPSVNIYGEKGTIKLAGNGISHWSVPDISNPFPPNEIKQEGANDPKAISYSNHKKQMINLLEAIEKGTRPIVAGEDGLQAIKLVYSIYESSRSEQVIPCI